MKASDAMKQRPLTDDELTRIEATYNAMLRDEPIPENAAVIVWAFPYLLNEVRRSRAHVCQHCRRASKKP